MTNDLQIKPEVQKGIKDLTQYAEDLRVTTGKDAEEAGIKLFQISELKKTVEDQRTAITKPMNLALRSANAFFKRFSEPLETIDQQIRAKVVEFGKTTEQTAFGVIHFRKNQVITVVDEAKVPKQYLTVDMKKVKLALEAGKTIPGIEVVEEKSVSL